MFLINSANPNRSLIRGIIAIVAGILVIVVPGLTINVVIQCLGGLLIADGLINLISVLIKKSKQQTMFSLIPRGTGNLIFGAILVLFPQLMVEIFVFLIGFILILAGGSQLASQISGRNVLGFSWLISIFSFIALFAGVVMLINPFKSAVTILLFLGIVFAVYGAGEIAWSFRVRKFKNKNPGGSAEIIDTDYEEVE